VGTSKHTGGLAGLHNKPAGCSASGAYAPGPEVEEEEEKKKRIRICAARQFLRSIRLRHTIQLRYFITIIIVQKKNLKDFYNL
jgi:hypothetical protein